MNSKRATDMAITKPPIRIWNIPDTLLSVNALFLLSYFEKKKKTCY
jgi:hypothetical protein